jgi:hypothetical protein
MKKFTNSADYRHTRRGLKNELAGDKEAIAAHLKNIGAVSFLPDDRSSASSSNAYDKALTNALDAQLRMIVSYAAYKLTSGS